MHSENKNQQRLYNDLSWTWHIISKPEDYKEEGEFFTSIIREYERHKTKTLLDIGCGGGNMDWVLKNEFDITSFDISENMINNARKLNPEIKYHVGDMRTMRLNRKFDAVMIHDAINYMTTPADLKAAFETAHEHLEDNGLLIVYAEQWPENFKQNHIRSQTEKKDNIEITFIEHYYDPDLDDTTYEGTFIYLIRRGGELETHFDRHLLGIFPLELWRDTICGVGFELHEDRFTHSEFAEGESYPLFIGIKCLTNE